MLRKMDDNRLSKSQLISLIAVVSSFIKIEIDSNLSSSSSSDDENEFSSDEEESDMSILYAILMVGNTRGENIPHEKLTDYVE